MRFVIGLFLALIATGQIAAEIPYPYAVTFQTVRPLLLPVHEELAPGEIAVRVGVNWANVWSAQLNRFTVDGEELSVEPHIRFALGARDQIGLSLPVKVVGGGVMDSSIETFHRSFAIRNQGREGYRRDGLNVSYEPLGPAYGLIDNNFVITKLREYDVRAYPRKRSSPPIPGGGPLGMDVLGWTEARPLAGGSRAGAGDPILSYQHVFFPGHEAIPKLSGGLLLKLPGAGDAPLSSEGTDVGVFVSLSGPLAGAFSYEFGVSYARLSDRRYLVLELPSSQWVVRTAVLRPIVERWSLIVEYVTFSRPVLDFGRLSERGHEVGVGLRRDYADGRLVIAAVENLISYATTPDFGLHVSYETRR